MRPCPAALEFSIVLESLVLSERTQEAPLTPLDGFGSKNQKSLQGNTLEALS